MSNPLVSICVPTRNRARSLRDSLQSVLAQDYSPIEILISDNCSDDDTEHLCREVARQDPRVRYVRHSRNIGLHGNHNFCMDESRGTYLSICHDHDRRDLGIVREYVSFLERHPHVGIVCSNWDLLSDSGEQIGVRDHDVKAVTPGLEYIGRTIRSGRSSIGIPGAMIRRAALGEHRFELDAPVGFGDFPIWFQVAETWDIGHLDKRLWSWRQSLDSQSARPIVEIAVDYRRNIEHYCEDHLRRRPQHAELVEGWRLSLRRYLFWALAYEVGLHCRDDKARAPRAAPSLFEIMNYRLTAEQLQRALTQMRTYRSGPAERLTYAIIATLIRCRLTQPLAWATRHNASLRPLLRLK